MCTIAYKDPLSITEVASTGNAKNGLDYIQPLRIEMINTSPESSFLDFQAIHIVKSSAAHDDIT